jgi:hypothetical protein
MPPSMVANRSPCRPVAETDLLASLVDEDGRIGKGDRLTRIAEPIANRQLIDVSTIHREGDMDVVRLQPFARVIASLALESTEISAERPPFNPLNLFAGNNDIISADAASLIYDADVEGEIAVRETAFPYDYAVLDQNAHPAPEQVAFEVADSARFHGGRGTPASHRRRLLALFGLASRSQHFPLPIRPAPLPPLPHSTPPKRTPRPRSMHWRASPPSASFRKTSPSSARSRTSRWPPPTVSTR